jgi:hypothetical protein
MNHRQAKKSKKLKKAIQANKRIEDWLPILEADRDWDYQFLETILKHKLSRMSACIAKAKCLANHKRVVRTINYAVYLLDRIQGNVDSLQLNEEFRLKWGDIKVEFEKVTEERYRLMKTYYSKATTEEERLQADEESTENYKKAEEKVVKLYKRLFEHMNKYWRGWWS